MAKVIAEIYDAETSDQVTIMLAESLKSLAQAMVADGQLTPKQILEISSALTKLIQAQNLSADAKKRQKADAEAKLVKAVDTIGKRKGMTAETIDEIKANILGVRE